MILETDGVLEVDASSPTGLRWLVDASTRARRGDPAGSDFQGRYWRIRYKGKDDLVHRVVWRIVNGQIPDGMQIDHIDGNGKNNNVENLRLVTCAMNQRNRGMIRTNNTGHTGVRYSVRDNGYEAVWHDVGGEQRTKFFSCRKYGGERARQLAEKFRNAEVAKLNARGAGYSDDHGLRRVYG